jgi:Flp pilus assembly protein TadG
MSTTRTRRVRFHDDRGAVLVEFALVSPFFFLLLFGIIEFGWIFAQELDVRHGAREGGRLIAVDYADEAGDSSDQVDALGAAVCERMDHADGATLKFELADTPPADTPPSFDDFAKVTITTHAETLTGFFGPLLDDLTLKSSVETRLEQDAHWIEDPWTAQTYTCP